MANEIAFTTRLPSPESKRELEVRALALEGRTVGELARALSIPLPGSALQSKGFIGQLVECVLGADPKASVRPDFPDLGVELKTLPVNAQGHAVESTFCCSINLLDAEHEVWETSRLYQRLNNVLWLPVEGARAASLGDRRFGRAVLWSPNAAEMEMLRNDWEDLMGTIGAGHAGTLTAHRGKVLQVRPKAAHAGIRTLAPGPEGFEMSLPLGFYLRTSFTTAILQQS